MVLAYPYRCLPYGHPFVQPQISLTRAEQNACILLNPTWALTVRTMNARWRIKDCVTKHVVARPRPMVTPSVRQAPILLKTVFVKLRPYGLAC